MMVFFLLLLFVFFKTDILATSSIPIIYQLEQAYTSSPKTIIASPLSTNETQVLGIATTSIITPSPANSPISSRTHTIAVLGDSMIDTMGNGIPQLQASLKKYYPNGKFNILNYGVGASTLKHALYRLKNSYEYRGTTINSLISQKPDIVVIESFAYNNYGNTQDGLNQQWLELGAATSIIREALPNAKIVLASTFSPNSANFGQGIPDLALSPAERVEKVSTINLYLQNLTNFATSQGFPLADAYHPSLFQNQGFSEFINSQDHLHPSSFGAEFFCDTIAKTISDSHLLN